MKTYSKIEDLIADSIIVESGLIAVYPQFNHESELDIDDTLKFNGCYAVNNSTVAFISNSIFYVTPYTKGAIQYLDNAGFNRRTFYVPFSNGDFPKDQACKWHALIMAAKKDAQEAFSYDCCNWCDKHGIGPINDDLLAKCFMLPNDGVKVKYLYYEDTYFPAITSTCLDCIAVERLGTFCYNNDRVVFVYRDGHTYVAKGYKIIRNLLIAGYKKKGFFVPFSSGEIIINPELASQWENIPNL